MRLVKMSSTSLLRIKTPSQMAHSDHSRRTEARTKSCLKKTNSLMNNTSVWSLQPINDSVTCSWLSTQSSLDSSWEDRRVQGRKVVSFCGFPHLESVPRRMTSSTPKHPSIIRGSLSVPNLRGKWSTRPDITSDYDVNRDKTGSVKDEKPSTADNNKETRFNRSLNPKVSSQKRIKQKKMVRSLSTLSSCFVGDANSLHENSFEEFSGVREATKTDTGIYVPVARKAQTQVITSVERLSVHKNLSKACSENNLLKSKQNGSTDRLTNLYNSEHLGRKAHMFNHEDMLPRNPSRFSTSASRKIITQRRRNKSASHYGQYHHQDSHVQKLSFDDCGEFCDETRPLDQSMSEFIKSADQDNLASLMEFYDRVVNKSHNRCTTV